MNIRTKIFGGDSGEPQLIKAKAPKGVRGDDLHSIPVTRTETRRANTREDDRHRLAAEPVEVVHDGKSYDVELVNLSGGGAMVSGSLPAHLWDRIDLKLGTDGSIECRLCWVKGDRFGLEFAHETRLDCSPSEQARILRQVLARNFPDAEFEAKQAAGEQRAESDGPDQRGGRRHPLVWSGTLYYDFESHPVRLRNISDTGAMIECPVTLPKGADPLLEFGEGFEIPCKVSWSVGDTTGLHFDNPIDLAQLANARPEIAKGQCDRPRYLARGKLSDAAAEDRWERMSLGELRESLEGFWKY